MNSALTMFPVRGYAGGEDRDDLYELLEPRLVD